MSFSRLCLALLGLLVIQSCAPALEQTVSVNYIEPLELRDFAKKRLSQVQVRVGAFNDERPTKNMGTIDGRRLQAKGDAGVSIRQAVEEQLRRAGAELSLFSGPLVSGSLTEWQIDVRPGFPLTEAESYATLRIQMSGPTGTPLYTASYSGSVTQKYPLLTQERVEKMLGEAVAYALREAFQDERLLAALK